MGTSVAPAPALILQFLNNSGAPNVGGTLLTQVGGVNYPTFQDAAGTTPLPNPIPLNSRGEISNSSGVSSQLFLATAVTYTITLFDANSNAIWTANNVTAQGAAAVGQMNDEKGSGGGIGFVAGVDFTAGTTTTLTLSGFYGSASNLWIAFDAAEQGADSYTLSGTTLTFNAPIPVGTNKVYVKGGTTLTIGIPGAGTVTDASVASGSRLYDRINDIQSITDYGLVVTGATFTSAITTLQGLGGGLLHMYSHSAIAPPVNYAGVLLEYDGPNTPINLFQLSGETIWFAQKVFASQINNTHVGSGYSAVHVENQPKGSGAIGPTNADYALTVSHLKQGFGGGSAVAGEMDGMYIVVRNDGSNSDTTAILADVGNYGAGFNAFFEAVTTGFVAGVTTYQIDVQAGVVDTRNNTYDGYVTSATKGALSSAYLCNSSGGASWSNLFYASNNGSPLFTIDTGGIGGTARLNIFDNAGGVKTIRTNSNALSVLSSGGAEIFNLGNTGNLVLGGTITAGTLTLGNGSAASATAGGASLPASPAGFLTGLLSATNIKIPYYNA